MKKNMLIFCTVLTTLSLTAFGYKNWSNTLKNQGETTSSTTTVVDNYFVKSIYTLANPDFFYDVDSRYIMTITKKELNTVKSMADFLPEDQIKSIMSFHSVSVTFLGDNYESVITETGESDVFTADQLKLLQSAPYSTNILIRAEYKEKNGVTGKLQYSYSTPHLTVIPEKEASYVNGKDALIKYLKENSKEKTAIVEQDKLQPGKVSFTVTRHGTISNVKLLATSGYPSIDKTMIELITKTPGKWESAANFRGERVDQELVFSFGIVGC